jgi:hypothetical protein
MADPCQSPGNSCNLQIRNRVDQNRGLLDNLLNRFNQLEGLLNGALNAGDLALSSQILSKVNTIDQKMGGQLEGGLAGKLTRLSQWLRLGQIMSVLNFAATLHNAYMLSNALTQTFFSMMSNVLAAAGIKDDEGNPYDVGSLVGQSIEAFAQTILGVETVDGIKAEWKKFNRIYQAAANIVFSLQSIGYSILEALEVVGSYVGKIGNAMKKFGVVTERAFGWMNPAPNFQNRFFTSIQNVTEFVEAIDSVAGEVQNIQETAIQLGQQRDALQQGIQEVVGDPPPETAPIATAEADANANSQTPPLDAADLLQP